MPELYIGLMSGTSLDGVDAILADLSGEHPRIAGHHHDAFPEALRAELSALNHAGDDELNRASRSANALAQCYAQSIAALLKATGITSAEVEAIGCHGQTVRHQPAAGYTIQLGNASLLAELTDISVVSDFRSRDVAAGGEGAPLVPAFHAAVFADPAIHRAIVNIGGIANITNLPPGDTVTGFDCGPGNLLLDAWAQKHLKQPFDRDGAWARSGKPIAALLTRLIADEYFRLRPPKSTGREKFDPAWLEPHLSGNENAADVQATLNELTARCIADAIINFCAGVQAVYLCGGGARNNALVDALRRMLCPREVAATDALGVDAEHVEALAFAWLARQSIKGVPGNLPAVTGARGPRILGAIYHK
jgi:anhydro-N-acetylmuramic acid kinase